MTRTDNSFYCNKGHRKALEDIQMAEMAERKIEVNAKLSALAAASDKAKVDKLVAWCYAKYCAYNIPYPYDGGNYLAAWDWLKANPSTTLAEADAHFRVQTSNVGDMYAFHKVADKALELR